jgi:hypothetical protein
MTAYAEIQQGNEKQLEIREYQNRVFDNIYCSGNSKMLQEKIQLSVYYDEYLN